MNIQHAEVKNIIEKDLTNNDNILINPLTNKRVVGRYRIYNGNCMVYVYEFMRVQTFSYSYKIKKAFLPTTKLHTLSFFY